MNLIDRNIDKVRDLCVKHKVNKLFAFGSVISTDFKPESVIDLVVDFAGVSIANYADNYFALKFSLEDLFSRNVDLLEEKAIKNPYLRQEIESRKLLIYG